MELVEGIANWMSLVDVVGYSMNLKTFHIVLLDFWFISNIWNLEIEFSLIFQDDFLIKQIVFQALLCMQSKSKRTKIFKFNTSEDTTFWEHLQQTAADLKQ